MKIMVELPDEEYCGSLDYKNSCPMYSGDYSCCRLFNAYIITDDDGHPQKCSECLKACKGGAK
jgi:hypothetical protein